MIALDQPHHVDEVRDDARVIRHDAHAIAGLERREAVDADRRVLLGEAFDRQPFASSTAPNPGILVMPRA